MSPLTDDQIIALSGAEHRTAKGYSFLIRVPRILWGLPYLWKYVETHLDHEAQDAGWRDGRGFSQPISLYLVLQQLNVASEAEITEEALRLHSLSRQRQDTATCFVPDDNLLVIRPGTEQRVVSLALTKCLRATTTLPSLRGKGGHRQKIFRDQALSAAIAEVLEQATIEPWPSHLPDHLNAPQLGTAWEKLPGNSWQPGLDSRSPWAIRQRASELLQRLEAAQTRLFEFPELRALRNEIDLLRRGDYTSGWIGQAEALVSRIDVAVEAQKAEAIRRADSIREAAAGLRDEAAQLLQEVPEKLDGPLRTRLAELTASPPPRDHSDLVAWVGTAEQTVADARAAAEAWDADRADPAANRPADASQLENLADLFRRQDI
jgi:hypothetical protein